MLTSQTIFLRRLCFAVAHLVSFYCLQYLEAKEHYQILDVGGAWAFYITAQELLGDKFDFHAIEHDQQAINYYKEGFARIQVCQIFAVW